MAASRMTKVAEVAASAISMAGSPLMFRAGRWGPPRPGQGAVT